MGKFIFKRVLSAIPTLFIVLTLVFFLMRVIPGNPLYSLVDEGVSAEELEKLSEKYGFNDPIYTQYFRYLGDVVRGNWGESYFNGLPVFENILSRLEPTVLIAAFSTLITILVGIPIGIVAAQRRNSLLDYALSSFSMIFLTIPIFWLGVMMVYFLAYRWNIFPTQGYVPLGEGGFFKSLYYLAMPCLALGLTQVAGIARYTRSAMLDVVNEDYIRTARAKGLSEPVVQFKHALKNTLSLISTLIAGSVAAMLGGSTVVETVFNINGVGKLAYDSLVRRDYPQEQAIILFMTMVFIVMNILMDIVYKLLDPRVEFD